MTARTGLLQRKMEIAKANYAVRTNEMPKLTTLRNHSSPIKKKKRKEKKKKENKRREEKRKEKKEGTNEDKENKVFVINYKKRSRMNHPKGLNQRRISIWLASSTLSR